MNSLPRWVIEDRRSYRAVGSWVHIGLSALSLLLFPVAALVVVLWADVSVARDSIEWKVFVALVAAQAGLWGMIWPRAREWHRTMAPLARKAEAESQRVGHATGIAKWSYVKQAFAGSILVVLAVFVLSIGSLVLLDNDDLTWSGVVSTLILAGLGFSAWFYLVLTMRAIYVATRHPSFVSGSQGADLADLTYVIYAYRSLANRLRVVLSIVGLLLGLLVVTAGSAIRVENVCRIDVENDPVQELARTEAACGSPATDVAVTGDVVLFYGLTLTGLLVAVYVPPHTRIGRVASEIVDTYVPIDGPQNGETETLADRLGLRAKIAAELGEHPGGTEALQGAIVILAPLLAGVGSRFLGG